MSAGADEQSIERSANVQVLLVLGGIELVSAKLHGLLLLGVSAREDDGIATALGRKLDGKVTKTANAQDTDASGRGDVVVIKAGVDGSTAALERSGVLVGETVGDLEEEGLLPDGGAGERTLVEVGVAVHGAARAVNILAGQALLAVAALVVLVAPADAVANLQGLDLGAKLLDDTDTLVAKSHVGAAVVEVSAAKAGSGDLDEDLIILEVRASSLGLDDGAGGRALVDGESVRHCERLRSGYQKNMQ